MHTFIEECLEPLYRLQSLREIYFDPVLMNGMLLFIAMQDNRLLKV